MYHSVVTHNCFKAGENGSYSLAVPPRLSRSDLRENIEKASVAYHGSANLLRSDDISLLRGCGLALDQLEGVFIRPPPTATRANDDLVSQFSSDAQEDIASQVASYGRVYSGGSMIWSWYWSVL